MASLAQAFARTDRPAFLPFLVAGYPTPEATVELALALEEAGADVLELGVPYSDPLADGPVIQTASAAALARGMTVAGTFALLAQMRRAGLTLPVVLLAYANTVLQKGERAFVDRLRASGGDGLIVPDLPHEEAGELRAAAAAAEVALVPLVAPTSRGRIARIVAGATGFVYAVSSLGVTGERDELHPDLRAFLAEVRDASPAPVAVGFGIHRREQVRAVAPFVDGVIVGSALVRLVMEREDDLISPVRRGDVLAAVRRFVAELLN